jgi:ribosomal protein S18 acetylase RimI-like enzyme
MMIKDLASTSLSDITKSFNEAFSDYVMQFTATEEYLQTRWKGAGVDFNQSFGLFMNDKLVGFIIHGISKWNGVKTAFNVGTGVIPEHRGKRIVKKLYDYAIPVLKTQGIKQCLLEVIQENKKAIKAYKSVGFKEERELLSFIYNLDQNYDETDLDIQILLKIENDIIKVNWDLVETFWDFKPSWENSISSLMRNPDIYQFVGIFKEDTLIGYVIFNPKTGYIPQFAIAKNERRKGYGRYLFQKLTGMTKQLAVINVDKRSLQTLGFLKAFGFKEFVSQYEMEKNLI